MIKNILLVDQSVPDYEVFLRSVNDRTKAVPYSSTTTYDQIREAFPGPVDQVGIVFVKGSLFLGKAFTDQYDFFASLVQQFEIKHLDFLACDTLDEWKAFYERFTGVIIGASNNRTGNIQYGGDWVMESTAEDVEGIYFTESIQYYTYLLDPESNSFFFTKNTGELYGMGENFQYNLGKNYNKVLTELNEVFMRDESMNLVSIDNIQKLRCSNGGITLFQKNNKLYGFGANSNQCLNSSAASGVVYYNPIEIPLPISGGTLVDFLPNYLNGEAYIYMIVNGRLFAKRGVYTELKTLDENDGMATMITGDSDGMAVVFNNEVYSLFPNYSPGPGLLNKMNFPAGTTGTITKIASAFVDYDHRIFAVRGGELYSRSTTERSNMIKETTIVGNPTVALTSVTDVATNGKNVVFVNNNILYRWGWDYGWWDGAFFCGTTLRDDKVISTPSGVIDTIILRGGSNSMMTLVGGIPYGTGDNGSSRMGGFDSYIYGFRAIPDSSNVTMLDKGAGYCAMVMNNKLYTLGDNNGSTLGTPKLSLNEPVPIPIQLNGSTFMNIDPKLISYAFYFTWIAVGDKLYCAGTNWVNMAGLTNSLFNYSFSTKFIEIPTTPAIAGPITFVSVSFLYNAIVKGGKLYSHVNSAFREMIFPPGVTGPVKALITPQHSLVVLIEPTDPTKSCVYVNRRGNEFSPTLYALTYQGQPLTSVTKMTACPSLGILCFRNGGFLLQSGAPGGSSSDFVVVPMPAGATGDVEILEAGNAHFCVVIGGVLYGMGQNDNNQLGTGPMSETALSKVYTNYNTTPITGVTAVKCTSRTTYVTINNTVYGFGNSDSGRLGLNAVNANLNLVATGIMGDRMTITSSSTINNTNFGANGVTFKIIGDLLTKIASVQFGPDTVTAITKSSALATFVVPAGSGSVTPVVTDSDGITYTLATFNYSNPMVLTGISANTGSPNSPIRVFGTNLTPTHVIRFGTQNVTSFSPITSTEYSFSIPEKGVQTNVSITVADQYGTTSNALSFTYTSLTVTDIVTESGISTRTGSSGSTVRFLGTNFTSGITFYVGNYEAKITKKEQNDYKVTLPYVLGTVKVRIYDENKNLIEFPDMFTCTPVATPEKDFPVVITYSTSGSIRDSTGVVSTRYFVGTNRQIMAVITTEVNRGLMSTFYTHTQGQGDIYGIAYGKNLQNGKNSIFFGDRSNATIYALDLSSNRTDYYTVPNMSPTAIKIKSATMYIACHNNNSASSIALICLNMALKTPFFTITYAGLSTYQFRGITYNTISPTTDTSIYVTAVPYNGEEFNIQQGRVIRFTSEGGVQNLDFVTNINNPRDLTFLNGYLVVDGAIQFYTPEGVPVASFETDATTIIAEGSNAFFTSTTGITSTLSLMTVEPYVEPIVALGTATPLSGPKGTYVFVQGNLLTPGNTSVLVNGIAHTDYWVSDILLTIRMPFGVGEVPIQVTAGGVIKTFTYTYVNPNIVTVIPLYLHDVKYYHFTGNSLRNIIYIAFGDQTTTTITVANRVPVTNVTDTSFDCSFNGGIPVNSTRVLLMDAYGTVTYEDSNMFTLSSETCFLGGTPVLTDQGMVPIEKIDPTFHTLDHQEIRAITKIRYNGNALVLLEQDSLRRKYPTRDTVISRKHKIYYKGKMKTAESLVGHKGVRLVPYRNQFLYNVLLDTPGKMSVNGLLCETLHPKNPIARYFI